MMICTEADLTKLDGTTYGGLKNCSSTTYMPRNNSAIRKYFPALSREDSVPSSHFFGGGRRKPGWGGPAGVAARFTEEEKFAMDPKGEERRGKAVGRE